MRVLFGKLLCPRFLYSPVCHLDWDDSKPGLSWTCEAESLQATTSRGLGFLTAWSCWSELSKTPRQSCKSSIGYRKVTKGSPDSRRGEEDHTSYRENGKVTLQNIYNRRKGCAIFGKYNLPHVITSSILLNQLLFPHPPLIFQHYMSWLFPPLLVFPYKLICFYYSFTV